MKFFKALSATLGVVLGIMAGYFMFMVLMGYLIASI